MMKPNLLKHLLKLFIALIIVAVLLKWANLHESFLLLKKAEISWLIGGIVCLLFVQIAKALRFHYLLRQMDQRVPLTRNILVHFIVPIIGLVTPAKLGEGLKVFLLGYKKRLAGFCFIIERLLDIIILVIVSLYSLIYLSVELYYIYAFILAMLVVAGMIFIFNIERIANYLSSLFIKRVVITRSWLRKRLKKLLDMRFITVILLSFAAWFFVFFMVYLLAVSIGISTSFINLSSVFAISVVIGFISSLPGGLGSREASFTFLLVGALGVSKSAAGSLAILIILAHYLLLSITAVVAYLILKICQTSIRC